MDGLLVVFDHTRALFGFPDASVGAAYVPARVPPRHFLYWVRSVASRASRFKGLSLRGCEDVMTGEPVRLEIGLVA